MTRKIVINTQYGGFGLTNLAIETYLKKKNVQFESKPRSAQSIDCANLYYINGEYFSQNDIPRDDPALVATVEELREEAADIYATLKIVEIPADVQWHIQEYDGSEWVAENHRTWR